MTYSQAGRHADTDSLWKQSGVQQREEALEAFGHLVNQHTFIEHLLNACPVPGTRATVAKI